VNLSFEYFSTAGQNERFIGLVTDGFTSAFRKLNEEKNYFISFEESDNDANFANTSNKTCLGIGNGVLAGYSFAASIGSLVKTTCTVEGLNITSYTGISGQNNPAIDYRYGTGAEGLFNLPRVLTR